MSRSHVRALATTASLLPLPLSARGVSYRSSPVHPSSGPSPPLFRSGRLSRGAFSLARIYTVFGFLLFLILCVSLIFSFARSRARSVCTSKRKGEGIGEKTTEVVEFGSRRGRGRTVEKGRKRRGDCTCRIKRGTGARQGRTGAVRWHKKRRSGKRKKERERERRLPCRGERKEKKTVNRGERKRGTKRAIRGKAVGGGKGREGERERDARFGVEAAGFLSRHRRSHPTKIDSVSLGSSVQRRATRRTFRPSLLVCSGRERQRVSSVRVVLFLLLLLPSFSALLTLSSSLSLAFPRGAVFYSLLRR